jgi:hypothetical protein
MAMMLTGQAELPKLAHAAPGRVPLAWQQSISAGRDLNGIA